jgi:4-hydroxy-tetrahydrodipicolinate synthase
MNAIVGSIVALVTPMHEDGSVDYDALRRLVDWHIAEGTACIGAVGTTGESPTVSIEENCEVIRVCVEHAKGRIPIMAGTGANSTAEAIELSKYALKVGADCTLSVVPYYNKPSQEGIYRHFKAIAEAVDLPMVLYNVPGRTVADMSVETTAAAGAGAGHRRIKEASGQIDRAAWLSSRRRRLLDLLGRRQHRDRVDAARRPTATSASPQNVAPRLMSQLSRQRSPGRRRKPLRST